MCNLYSITTNQAAIIALFRVVNRYVGNLPPMPGVFPDDPAPVVQFWRRPRTATPSGCSTPTGKIIIGDAGSWRETCKSLCARDLLFPDRAPLGFLWSLSWQIRNAYLD